MLGLTHLDEDDASITVLYRSRRHLLFQFNNVINTGLIWCMYIERKPYLDSRSTCRYMCRWASMGIACMRLVTVQIDHSIGRKYTIFVCGSNLRDDNQDDLKHISMLNIASDHCRINLRIKQHQDILLLYHATYFGVKCIHIWHLEDYGLISVNYSTNVLTLFILEERALIFFHCLYNEIKVWIICRNMYCNIWVILHIVFVVVLLEYTYWNIFSRVSRKLLLVLF